MSNRGFAQDSDCVAIIVVSSLHVRALFVLEASLHRMACFCTFCIEFASENSRSVIRNRAQDSGYNAKRRRKFILMGQGIGMLLLVGRTARDLGQTPLHLGGSSTFLQRRRTRLDERIVDVTECLKCVSAEKPWFSNSLRASLLCTGMYVPVKIFSASASSLCT